jgi:hypothetical protein
MIEDMLGYLLVADAFVFAFWGISSILKQWFEIAIMRKTYFRTKKELR